jgi:hypothetical protein
VGHGNFSRLMFKGSERPHMLDAALRPDAGCAKQSNTGQIRCGGAQGGGC